MAIKGPTSCPAGGLMDGLRGARGDGVGEVMQGFESCASRAMVGVGVESRGTTWLLILRHPGYSIFQWSKAQCQTAAGPDVSWDWLVLA